MITQQIITIKRIANFTGLTGVIVLLITAHTMQFMLFELPCPLCLFQRLGFLGMALGFIMNMRFGFRPSHYSIILINGFFTAFIALIQIALHVVPGTAAYGSPVFGLHLYVWSFIVSVGTMIITSTLLGCDRQYDCPLELSQGFWRPLTNFMFLILSLVMLSNIITIFLMCGFQECSENPVRYELLGNWLNHPIGSKE